MIFDLLPYLSHYLPPSIWNALEPLMERLHPEMPKSEYVLQQQDITARVSLYQTKPIQEGQFESHKQHVDIQILLSGSEWIDVAPHKTLIPYGECDTKNDVQFYKAADHNAVRLTMVPGNFALFFPQDAHRPGLNPQGEVQNVEKVVVKIPTRSFGFGGDRIL